MIRAEGENGADIRAARTLGDFVEISISEPSGGFKVTYISLSIQDAFEFARDLLELTKVTAREVGR